MVTGVNGNLGTAIVGTAQTQTSQTASSKAKSNALAEELSGPAQYVYDDIASKENDGKKLDSGYEIMLLRDEYIYQINYKKPFYVGALMNVAFPKFSIVCDIIDLFSKIYDRVNMNPDKLKEYIYNCEWTEKDIEIIRNKLRESVPKEFWDMYDLSDKGCD